MNAANVTLKQVSSVVTIAQRDQTPRHTDGCLTMLKGHLMMSSSVYLVDNKENDMRVTELKCFLCQSNIKSLTTTTAHAVRGNAYLFQCLDCVKAESE
jgi:hypothetical protein